MGRQKDRDGKPGVDEGRRKLIKAAAVAGGAAVAVGALPGDWKKPIATVGGLPAHAQTSDAPITIPDNRVRILTLPLDQRGVTRNGFLPTYLCSFYFSDPLCEIDDTATLWARVDPCGEIRYDDVMLKDIRDAQIQTNDGCAGNIEFPFMPCDLGNGSLVFRLSSKDFRQSRKVTAHFTVVNGT